MIGLIIPAKISAICRLMRPKKRTTSPAALKNTPERALVWMPSELNDRSARTGNVPSANADIVSAPAQKSPVVSVYICIDCVNPHGRKKVAAPKSSGVSVWFTPLS